MSNSMIPFNGQGTYLNSQTINPQTGQYPYPNGYQQTPQVVFPNTVVGNQNGMPITQTMNEAMLANNLDIVNYNSKCQARVAEADQKDINRLNNRLKLKNRGVALRKNTDRKLCTMYKDLNGRERIGDPVCDIVDLGARKLVSHFRGKDYVVIWLIDDSVKRLIKSSEDRLPDVVDTENLWFIPINKANSKSLAKFLSQVGHGIQTHRYNKHIIYDLVYQFVSNECSDKIMFIPFTTGWVKCYNSWTFVPEGTMTMRGILGL